MNLTLVHQNYAKSMVWPEAGWRERLGSIGMRVLLVTLPVCEKWIPPDLGESLGSELEQTGHGWYVSTFENREGIRWLFFHVSNHDQASKCLKAPLAAHGMDELARIIKGEEIPEI